MPRKKIVPEVTPEPELTPETPILESIAQEPTPKAEAPVPAFRVERTVESGSIYLEPLPVINAGVCEFCGNGEYERQSAAPARQTADYTVNPDTQLGRCKHYNGVKIRCSYCPMATDFKDAVMHRKIKAYKSIWNPGEIILVCSDMTCRDAHLKRLERR